MLARPYRAGRKISNAAIFRCAVILDGERSAAARRRTAGGKAEERRNVRFRILPCRPERDGPALTGGQRGNQRPRRRKALHTTAPPPPIAAKQLAADLAEAPLQPAARWDALCRVLARPYRAGRKILNAAIFRRSVVFDGERSTAAQQAAKPADSRAI